MSTVISVENLGKKYIIGHQQQEPYLTLRDSIAEKFKETGRRLLHPFLSSSGQPLISLASTEEFWALKDVRFDIQQGERVGIIGRNGAGKTTLLKILSRITEPTTGRFAIKDRVASLLEVGTGFHPELTGRENVFLNGAILGMRKTEIRKKFDEIIAFADVEKFLDTPVKRYSSGMYVRLAFAVAAHLEPDILIVDEVLAVGDAAFQKKCLGKMEEAAREGRTVLCVSHNMGAIETLCSRALLLKQGQVGFLGSARQTISNYFVENYAGNDNPFENCSRSGNGSIKISSFHLEPHTIERHWLACLRALGIRVRGMYTTKDTYVSTVLAYEPIPWIEAQTARTRGEEQRALARDGSLIIGRVRADDVETRVDRVAKDVEPLVGADPAIEGAARRSIRGDVH